ncbi:MAG: hypothetical protein EAZ43_14375 [Betaproteobacteria bacterium]|nr:MAG: hypothetical protein EAZ43_14375 [Betaproteobacteria bacterium]
MFFLGSKFFLRCFAAIFGSVFAAASFGWTINTSLSVPIGNTASFTGVNVGLQLVVGSQGPATVDFMSFNNPAFAVDATGGNCGQGKSFGSAADVGPNNVLCPLAITFTPSILGPVAGTLTVRCSAVSSAGGVGLICDGTNQIIGVFDAIGLQGLAVAVPTASRWAVTLLALMIMGWAMLRIRGRNAV